jgi:poly-gamma-glutamate capsule biosynthesis protein CapA/YwtB (metallophosphatase superfamily)
MSFDTTPDNLPMLKAAGFTHLSLSNNHADDFGPQVTLDSRAAIEAAGLIPFGDPGDSENFIIRENLGGVSLSLVGFHAFGEKTTELTAAIQNEKAQGRFVIVYPHWGVEYATTAPGVETQAAQTFINAGADLIIGAHPHVVQNIEVIDGVPVVYSLGNFLFDQDFSPETQQGLIAHVTITPETLELTFTPVRILNRQTTVMEEPAASQLLLDLGLTDGRLSVSRQ